MSRAAPSRFTLNTPEGVPLHWELASLPERVTALVVDLLVMTVPVVVLVLLATLGGFALPGFLAFLVLVLFALRYGYFFFFEIHWRGSTPGKRLMGLRVVSREGTGLRVDSVLARNLMRDLELFLPLTLVLAPEQLIGASPWWLRTLAFSWVVLLALLPFLTRQRTRVGDLIAGTVVVHEPSRALLPDEAARPEHAQDQVRFSAAQLAVYGEHELETLADILHKSSQGWAKDEQLRTIARTIARRIGYEGDQPVREPERFLNAFYRQQRAELERRLIYGKRIASKHDRQ